MLSQGNQGSPRPPPPLIVDLWFLLRERGFRGEYMVPLKKRIKK